MRPVGGGGRLVVGEDPGGECPIVQLRDVRKKNLSWDPPPQILRNCDVGGGEGGRGKKVEN